MAFNYGLSAVSGIADTRGVRSQPAVILMSSMTFALVICLTKITHASGNTIEHRFRTLTGESLKEMWHTDCHRRCRHQLIEHVDLACRFDPYKIVSKRSVDIAGGPSHNKSETKSPPPLQAAKVSSLFISKDRSASFLKSYKLERQGHSVYKRAIMDECCITKACSWEEYAEFCHSDNRRTATHFTNCYP